MKKLYTLIITVLVTTFGFAQLTVTNSAYIYVDGDGFTEGPNVAPLFVTDEVRLTGADSNIYLRNEGQLIQGNNVGNIGTGKLSVYQTGTANTYIYNYWTSPVGNTDASNTGNRPFRANTNFYDVVTAPITSSPATFTTAYDGSSSPLVISSSWLYAFDPGILYTDWDVLSDTGSLNAGYGFTMKGNSSGGQLYDFRGKPHNGTITVNINNGLETLVGNPYPSALDAYYFINDPLNTGIADNVSTNPYTTGVLKYWEQAPGATSHLISNYIGGYAHYTAATDDDNSTPSDLTDDTIFESFVPAVFTMYLLDGSPAAGPPITNTGGKLARRYLPIGQGFMIEGKVNGTVIFSNSQRAFYKQSGAQSYFYREDISTINTDTNPTERTNEVLYTEEGYSLVSSSLKRFRINTGFDNNGTESYTRQLLMNLHDSATTGFDYGFEAKGGGDLESDAYWILNDDPYLIQAFQYDIELKIPLIVNISNEQLSRFSIVDVQNFETDQPIYIHDKQREVYTNLQEQAYELTLEAGNYTNRFEITFQAPETLNVEEITDEDFLVYQNTKDSELTVLNPNSLNIKSVRLIDVSGKVILNTNNVGTQNEYRFTTKSLSDGIYVATVTVDNNQAISKKVVIKN